MTNAKINDQKKADADLKKAESEKRADQKKKEKKIKDLQGQGCPDGPNQTLKEHSFASNLDIPDSRPNGPSQSR